MKRTIAIILTCITLTMCSCTQQQTGANIEEFNKDDVSETYQISTYDDYIEAICTYYNVLIGLCDDLVKSDYGILIESEALDLAYNSANAEFNKLNSDIIDKNMLLDIAYVNQSFTSTHYLVSKFNSENVRVQYIDDEIIRSVKDDIDISIYDDIVSSIEEARKTLGA